MADGATARICEIGAGSGRVAYWTHRLGMTSITLVDLPHVNVVQGYYLLKNLPEGQVSLYGEPETTASTGNRVRVLPGHGLSTTGGHKYDLVLNQDSFPEMHPDKVSDYLRWIRSSCSGKLMSINHESKRPYGEDLAHLSVSEAVEQLGGFVLEDRFPYWLRKGYVAQIYRVAA